MKSVEEKIRNLMAKATDPAASEAEAETAMQMARKLMEKHNLSEADIADRGADAFVMMDNVGRATKFGTAFHPVDKYLGKAIAEYCACRCWVSRMTDPAKFVYFGVESDIEFASHLRAAWIKHFDLHWETYAQDVKRIKDRAAARQSFSVGFADEMRSRLERWKTNNQKADETSTALVLKRQDLVTAEMARRGIHLGRGRGMKSFGVNSQAAGAGVNAARSASVGRGVGGGVRMIGN